MLFSLSYSLKYPVFHLTFFHPGLLARNEVYQYDPPEYKYFHFRNSKDPGYSSLLMGELRCKLLIHINILVFPLELASWLDAIKIKSTNAVHTSAGSHLLFHRETG